MRVELVPGEEVILDFKPHWRQLVPAAIWTLLIGVVYGGAVTLFPVDWKDGIVGTLLGAGAVVAWLIFGLPPITKWMSSSYVLTSRRLLYRHGVFRRTTQNVPIEQVNSLTVTRGIVDRLLGSGELTIESASESGDIVWRDVPHPGEVELAVEQARSAVTRAEARGDDMAGQKIAELAELLDQGAISEEEFEAKKAELLRRM